MIPLPYYFDLLNSELFLELPHDEPGSLEDEQHDDIDEVDGHTLLGAKMPHDFSSHVLRRYFEATGWNEANSYLNLTSSSGALLDFTIPPGVSLSFSASPSSTFFNTYRLRALPTLRGAFGYIYASIDPERLALDGTPASLDIGTSSARVRFKDVIDRFKVHEIPRRPLGRSAVWQGGRRVDKRDYLMYGCIHVPSGRLDALYTTRLAETWQLLVTAVSSPPRLSSAASTLADIPNQQQIAPQQVQAPQYPPQPYGQPQPSVNPDSSAPAAAPDSGASAYGSGSVGPPGSTNLQFTLQNDTGRWCTEYSYSADDALWGFRVLHNFGWPGQSSSVPTQQSQLPPQSSEASEEGLAAGLRSGSIETAPSDEAVLQIPDMSSGGEGRDVVSKPTETTSLASVLSSSASAVDDLAVGGGLRGRFSAGAELFFSAVEKSAGLSTGIRFMTLPEPSLQAGENEDLSSDGRVPSQPPTIITATLNPMLGHLSTAYAARMSRNAVVGSRFDFNVYSYESEFTIGAEYWLRGANARAAAAASSVELEEEIKLEAPEPELIAPSTSASLRDTSLAQSPVSPKLETSLRPPPPASSEPLRTGTSQVIASTAPEAAIHVLETQIDGATAPQDAVNGVLKFRFSSSADVALLWEGRLRNCLVNLGVRADLSSRSAPIKSVGLDVLYFGTAGSNEGAKGR
ncbi:Mitochondrial distribution and morphology protein 10 [Tilletia horrida]|uniref:Mitochondrial distribution and morphology protein 10 n=1 Tax=Tilletia horrida TaxID=155126 RepID=A0AAN6GPT2_9BASI|nr:Mitochondrial distribution and morphology protein 10 [Tilletia horrida]